MTHIYKLVVACVLLSIATYSKAQLFGFQTIQITPQSRCSQINDGSIFINVTRNPEESVIYTLTLENQPSNPIIQENDGTFRDLPAGNYRATALNETTNKRIEASIVVPLSLPLNISTTFITPVSTPGGNNGAISVTATGGKGDYSYILNNLPTSNNPNFNNLTAGVYRVTVLSQDGCPGNSITVTITEPALN